MLTNDKKPSKEEQLEAMESYEHLSSSLAKLRSAYPEIEIEDTQGKIRIPLKALKMLEDVLQKMSEGQEVSVLPEAAEVTTQKAAEILNCSRPHVIKLLENDEIDYRKVGKHRRILIKDLLNFKRSMKEKQKQHLIDIIKEDESSGLYDS